MRTATPLPLSREDRPPPRAFFDAPQSVTSLVAAFLEPTLMVACYVAVLALLGKPFDRASMSAMLFVYALAFPGTNRFDEGVLAAAVGIVLMWMSLATVLLLCAWASGSLGFFDLGAVATWLTVTPFVLLGAVVIGQAWRRREARNPASRRRAVIIGGGPLALKVAGALAHRGDVELAGCFEDRSGDRLQPELSAQRRGGLADVAAFVDARGVHEVYITLALGSQPRILALLESLQGTTASLYFVPDVFGTTIIQGRLRDMHGVPVVGLCETPFTGTNELAKRAIDIALASIVLALAAPLLLVIAVGVKLSSPGPVIFRQRRNGLDGREIVVYKFRTMTVQDNGDVVAQATRGDRRVTRFGALLRRTSLDELPQFFNVLQGRMSVVGPRPHAVAHNRQYRELIKAYMLRHKVRPGITGWAQVNGLRGETDTLEKMHARVEHDLEYLRNWSVSLDLQIIARTLLLVARDRKAY